MYSIFTAFTIATLLSLGLFQAGGGPQITEFRFEPPEIAPGDPFTATFKAEGEIHQARLSVDTRPHSFLLFSIPAQFNPQTKVLTGKFPPIRVSNALEGQSVTVALRVSDRQGRYAFAKQQVLLKPNSPPLIVSVELPDGETFTAGNTVSLRIVATEPTGTPLSYQFKDGTTPLGDWSKSPEFSWKTDKENDVGLHTLTYEVRNKFQKMVSQTVTVYGFRAPIPPPE